MFAKRQRALVKSFGLVSAVVFGACASTDGVGHVEPVTLPSSASGGAQADEGETHEGESIERTDEPTLGRNGTIGLSAPPSGPGPAIRLGPVDIRGALDQIGVIAVAEAHFEEVSACFGETGQAQAAIRLIVSPTGAVQVAVPVTDGDTVETCIAGASRRWLFEQPQGGGVGVVLFTFEAIAP